MRLLMVNCIILCSCCHFNLFSMLHCQVR